MFCREAGVDKGAVLYITTKMRVCLHLDLISVLEPSPVDSWNISDASGKEPLPGNPYLPACVLEQTVMPHRHTEPLICFLKP